MSTSDTRSTSSTARLSICTKSCIEMASKRAAARPEREKAVSTTPKKKKPSPPKVSNCGCKGNCGSRRCGCVKKGAACGDSCKCTGCKNPFNILKDYNVKDYNRAARDRCLMDNIFKIEDLRGRLEKRYLLYCCEVSVQLKDMIPGIVKCPAPGCFGKSRFSWCRDRAFQLNCRGMKHCEKCRECVDEADRHCDDCNTCYFEGRSCYSCPCKGPDETGRFTFFGGYFPELLSKDMVGWSADLSGDECRGDISFEWLVDIDSSEDSDNVGRSVGDGHTGGINNNRSEDSDSSSSEDSDVVGDPVGNGYTSRINNNRSKDSDSSSSEDSDIVGDSVGNGYTGGINNDWSEDSDSSEDSF
ncbi:Hypp292 [Branchiostoma lanceolatum]|uniref:Hypp292 protein n=1 Tax=Branchiostoma lanceolatum TaxID=7740 RepID=A0A8J9VZ46_BRALA|nr:Hypp292 [Branchiostoma lanceolatum]